MVRSSVRKAPSKQWRRTHWPAFSFSHGLNACSPSLIAINRIWVLTIDLWTHEWSSSLLDCMFQRYFILLCSFPIMLRQINQLSCMCFSINTVCHTGQKKSYISCHKMSLHFQFTEKKNLQLLFCKILESSKGKAIGESPSSDERNKSVVFE